MPPAASRTLPDGGRVLGYASESLALWDVKTGEEVLTLAGNAFDTRQAIRHLAPCPGKPYLLAQDITGVAAPWNYHTGKLARRFEDKLYSVVSASFTPDGTHLFSDGEYLLPSRATGGSVVYTKVRQFRLWDISSGKVAKSFARESCHGAPVAVSADCGTWRPGRWCGASSARDCRRGAKRSSSWTGASWPRPGTVTW